MQIVKTHFLAYPKMEPTDVIKLLYQRAFGGGHIISDTERSLSYLREEWEALPEREGVVRTENIGGGVVRLYLGGIPEAALPTVNRLFVRSAALHKGDPDGFQKSLDVCGEMARNGEMPFSADAWGETLTAYRRAGCPMVRHSSAYREAYAPAYRVIAEKYVPLLPLLFAIDEMIAGKGHAVLAVDGMCGSGKSTLARLLRELYDAAVVYVDDFFLPPPLRTPRRLSEAGGNMHRERFLEEVIPHLGSGLPFSYRPFDCSCMALGDPREVPTRPLTVVEGSYALHPDLRGAYDLTAYVCCTPAAQRERLKLRCRNEALFARFTEEWIPMEARYEKAFSVRSFADFVIDTTDTDFRES